jgi:hydrogenase maturation protease
MSYRGDRDTRVSTVFDTLNGGRSAGVEERSEARQSILVLGLGNTLLTDDGAGVQVVMRLQQASDIPDRVSLIDGGTLSFSLLSDITDATGLVVVDAARMGLPPGTVRCFEDEAMDRFLIRNGQCSVHEVGLAEVLDMARLQDGLPARRALVAIQPGSLEWGPEPTAAVAAALPHATACVRFRIGAWLA